MIQHTKLPQIKVSNHFLHKMPVRVNFTDLFFHDCFGEYVQRFQMLFHKNKGASNLAMPNPSNLGTYIHGLH